MFSLTKSTVIQQSERRAEGLFESFGVEQSREQPPERAPCEQSVVPFVFGSVFEPWPKFGGCSGGRFERHRGCEGFPDATSEQRVERELIGGYEFGQRLEVECSGPSRRAEMARDPEGDTGVVCLVFSRLQLGGDELTRCAECQ